MTCKKLKYKYAAEFPEPYKMIIITLNTKREMINQLMMFQEMHIRKKKENPKYVAPTNWTTDITRISSEYGGLLFSLPKHIKEQYELFAKYMELYEKAQQHMYDREYTEANECWKQAKSMLCCGEEDHCG